MKDEKETCLPDRQVCNECGVSVKFGSGHFVNRVPDLNDLETRLEMGKPFPQGEFICSKCDNENNIDANFLTREKTKSDKMLSFEQFCQHFGLVKPDGYAPILDAYIQYEFDFFHGGYVPPDKYYSKR